MWAGLCRIYLSLSLLSTATFCDELTTHVPEGTHCKSDSSIAIDTTDAPLQLNFLSFIPCKPATPLSKCYQQSKFSDVFLYPAMMLAEEYINNKTVGKFCSGNESRSLRVDVAIKYIESRTDGGDASLSVFNFINQSLIQLKSSFFDATIAPGNSHTAENIAYISATKRPTVSISYGAPDTRFNNNYQRYLHFFRTLPSYAAVNLAILKLMSQFNWERVALLSSEDKAYARSMANFAQQATDMNIDILSLGSISFDLDVVFGNWRALDVKIIVGMFGPAEARAVICQASAFSLLGDSYVWILPHYQHPTWWRRNESNTNRADMNSPLNGLDKRINCSDSEMVDLLQSVLFVDSLKYNVMATADDDGSETRAFHLSETVDSFLGKLKEKTRALYPDLDYDESWLRESRAAASFDAVVSLALAYDEMLRRREYENLTIHLSKADSVVSLSESLADLRINGLAKFHHFRKSQDFKFNVLVAQFIDGAVRPIEVITGLNLIDNTNCSSCCVLELNDSVALPGYSVENYSYFVWKSNSNMPPSDGSITIMSHIDISSLVIASLIILLAVIFSTVIIISMLVFHKNRHIKATSRKFLLIAIIGFFSVLPSSILTGFTYSTNYYNISSMTADCLCIITPILFHTGFVVAFSVLIVKTWRVYRIFHNTRNETLKDISDFRLMVMFFILLVPYIFVLLFWMTYSTPSSQVLTDVQSTSKVFELSFCNDNEGHSRIWIILLASYQLLLLMTLLFLSYKNSVVTKLREHTEEGQAGTRMVVAVIVMTLVTVCVYNVLKIDLQKYYRPAYWLTVLYTTATPIMFLAVIFMPKFILMYREYRQKKIFRRQNKITEQTSIKMKTMQRQATELKIELHDKEEKIILLRKQSVSASSFQSYLDGMSHPPSIS